MGGVGSLGEDQDRSDIASETQFSGGLYWQSKGCTRITKE